MGRGSQMSEPSGGHPDTLLTKLSDLSDVLEGHAHPTCVTPISWLWYLQALCNQLLTMLELDGLTVFRPDATSKEWRQSLVAGLPARHPRHWNPIQTDASEPRRPARYHVRLVQGAEGADDVEQVTVSLDWNGRTWAVIVGERPRHRVTDHNTERAACALISKMAGSDLARLSREDLVADRPDFELPSPDVPARISALTPTDRLQKAISRNAQQEVADALLAEEFQPFFQPIVYANSGTLAGFEVLCRWHHSDGRVLSPQDFLATIEAIGASAELDWRIAQQAFRIQQHWKEETGHLIPLSINVCLDRLSDARLLGQILALGSRARVLSLELIETIYLDDPKPEVRELIRDLRDLGTNIDIDDFGTGRTSIVALTALRPNRIKLDRRLVAPMRVSDMARDLVERLISVAQLLDISITAEGVETAEVARLLTDVGCDKLQGYFFSKPLPADQALQTYLNWEARKPAF